MFAARPCSLAVWAYGSPSTLAPFIQAGAEGDTESEEETEEQEKEELSCRGLGNGSGFAGKPMPLGSTLPVL